MKNIHIGFSFAVQTAAMFVKSDQIDGDWLAGHTPTLDPFPANRNTSQNKQTKKCLSHCNQQI